MALFVLTGGDQVRREISIGEGGFVFCVSTEWALLLCFLDGSNEENQLNTE